MAKCVLCHNMTFSYTSAKTKDNDNICYDCISKILGKQSFEINLEDKQTIKGLSTEELQSRYDSLLKIEEAKKVELEEKSKAQLEAEQKRLEIIETLKNRMVVTTCDIRCDYDVIGPVFFQVNNRGDQYRSLALKHADLFELKEESGQMSNDSESWREIVETLLVNSAASIAHSSFDRAFFIAVEELKERAALLGADAVIGMRYDMDLDTNGFQYFYLQMYGTAVKYK